MLRLTLAALVAISTPANVMAETQTTLASYYYHGTRTANGERYNPDGLTAAHKTLPFGTRVKVTHLKNGRNVVVRINDRGPFVKGRSIDLSRGAARALGMLDSGTARVSIEIVK